MGSVHVGDQEGDDEDVEWMEGASRRSCLIVGVGNWCAEDQEGDARMSSGWKELADHA